MKQTAPFEVFPTWRLLILDPFAVAPVSATLSLLAQSTSTLLLFLDVCWTESFPWWWIFLTNFCSFCVTPWDVALFGLSTSTRQIYT